MLNKVVICGIDTSSLEVIPSAEMKELMKKIKAGDAQAREKFIRGNLKLVLSVLRRFAGRGEDPDDLFQVGCIGLIKAIDNFDMSQDVRFSTYAVPMIIGELRRYLRDNNPIRVSRSVRDTAYKALTAKERLTNELGREPTPEEIAKNLGITRKEVVLALEAIVDPVSLFDPVYSDDSDTLYVMDQVSDRGDCDTSWVEELNLREAMKTLSDREKKIIMLRFMNGKTQTETAAEIGISQAQVSRLEKSALTRIKEMI